MAASLDEANQARLENFLAARTDFSLGRLWWIREDSWIDETKKQGVPYDQDSERTGHPAVSCRTDEPPSGLFERVPVSLGTKARQKCPLVVACGLTRRNPGMRTFFKLILPSGFPVSFFLSKDEDADPNKLSGKWHVRAPVVANFHKPTLNDSEKDQLKQNLMALKQKWKQPKK